MKKLTLIISAGIMSMALAACSGPNYVMHTTDGRQIVTEGKPTRDDDTSMLKYKDAEGNSQQINQAEVKELSKIE